MASASVSLYLTGKLRRVCRTAVYCALFTLAAYMSVGETARALGNPTDLRAVEPTPEDIEQAAKYFDEGRAAFRGEAYVEAAEAFEKADALAPNAKVLLLAIQSRELGGHLARAATLAALAEQRHPKDPLFADLGDLLKTARESLHLLVVTCEQPCQIAVGNRLVHGPAATRRFVYLEEGKYRIRASWGDGQALSKYHEAGAGQRGKLRFEDEAAPETTADSADEGDWDSGPEPTTKRAKADTSDIGEAAAEATSESEEDWGDAAWGEDPPDDPLVNPEEASETTSTASAAGGADPLVFWSGVAVTGVLVGVSTWSGIDTLQHPGADTVVAKCVGLGESCPEYQEGLRNQQRTNILWGVTGGVGVITALIGAFWTDWGGESKPSDEPLVSVSLVPLLTEMRSGETQEHRVRVDGSLVTASGRF